MLQNERTLIFFQAISGGHLPNISLFKNLTEGFISAISCIFFSLRHALISFSLQWHCLHIDAFQTKEESKRCICL